MAGRKGATASQSGRRCRRLDLDDVRTMITQEFCSVSRRDAVSDFQHSNGIAHQIEDTTAKTDRGKPRLSPSDEDHPTE